MKIRPDETIQQFKERVAAKVYNDAFSAPGDGKALMEHNPKTGGVMHKIVTNHFEEAYERAAASGEFDNLFAEDDGVALLSTEHPTTGAPVEEDADISSAAIVTVCGACRLSPCHCGAVSAAMEAFSKGAMVCKSCGLFEAPKDTADSNVNVLFCNCLNEAAIERMIEEIAKITELRVDGLTPTPAYAEQKGHQMFTNTSGLHPKKNRLHSFTEPKLYGGTHCRHCFASCKFVAERGPACTYFEKMLEDYSLLTDAQRERDFSPTWLPELKEALARAMTPIKRQMHDAATMASAPDGLLTEPVPGKRLHDCQRGPCRHCFASFEFVQDFPGVGCQTFEHLLRDRRNGVCIEARVAHLAKGLNKVPSNIERVAKVIYGELTDAQLRSDYDTTALRSRSGMMALLALLALPPLPPEKAEELKRQLGITQEMEAAARSVTGIYDYQYNPPRTYGDPITAFTLKRVAKRVGASIEDAFRSMSALKYRAHPDWEPRTTGKALQQGFDLRRATAIPLPSDYDLHERVMPPRMKP